MLATHRVVIVHLVLATKFRVRQGAMQFLLGRTVGMVEYNNVKQVILVMGKQPIKQLVYPDRTQQEWDPFHALNVHQERMQDRMA